MRFSFPPGDQTASAPEADIEEQSPEHDIPGSEIATPVTPPPSDVARAELPVVTAKPVVTPEPGELTPESAVSAVEAPVEANPLQLPAEPEPQPATRPRPRLRRKVIAFPRQPEAAERVHSLADPVVPEQPRILDVPEELEAFPTPFLDGLQFEPATQASVVSRDHIELPFCAVSISQRLYGALMDCLVVATATFVFAAIGHKMLPDLVLTKPVRVTAALVPVLLWAIYQYLLLVYAGRTVGMQVAATRLTTFKGRPPSLRHRRNRALSLYFSTASLTMGLLWAFVDVDGLCWHDRISGTYTTKRE